MWRQNFLFVVSLLGFLELVLCEEKSNYERSPRQGKLFTFHTVDDEIQLDLMFTIPFLKIPAKKTVDTVHGMWSGVPTININPATLAVGGAIVLGTTILLPFVLKSYAHHQSHHGYSRLLDHAEFSTDSFLEVTSQMLSNGQAVRGCVLRVACWTGQRSNMDHVGTLRDILSNSLLSTIINSTAVEEAMELGRKGRECTTYNPCPLREEHIPIVFSNLAVITNSIG